MTDSTTIVALSLYCAALLAGLVWVSLRARREEERWAARFEALMRERGE